MQKHVLAENLRAPLLSQANNVVGLEGEMSDSTEEFDHGRRSVHDEYQVTIPPLQTTLKNINMPSSEVAMFLIEIYFARLYNAHLLFHKETFLADFAANRVPDFVALGIFASASIFLRQGPMKSQQLTSGDGGGVEIGLSMLSAADWTKQGDEWAEAGCQRALMQADIPRIEIVQACQCLALYWWAVGERERTHIISHNAYMNARLLGLHVQADDVEGSFEDEVRRRLFWACWMNQCIGQENASFKGEPWKDAVGLKFPSDEESWNAKRSSAKEGFDGNGNIVNVDGSEIDPIPSEEGETVKLLGLWWEVQRFLSLPCEDTLHEASSKIAAIHELDHRLGKVLDNLHPHLQYTNATTFASPKIDKYRLFSIHTLYRATCCALYSSIVPLFANTPINPHVSKKTVRLAAEESVKHAAVILDMATALMSSRPDISRLPSMVGFAMFVASTIQFKSLGAQRKLQTYGTGRFKAAIVVLDCLKEYWDSLQGLWTNLKTLFASAGINMESIPSDPRYQLNPDDQNTDLDKIVSQEGTSQSGDAAALYTYVATQEARGGSSPRRGSDSHSQGRRAKSAQNTPSPGSTAIQEHKLPIHQRQDGQIHSNTQIYPTSLQQPHAQQPRNQSFEQPPFPEASNYRRQSVGTMASSNFLPLGPVPEGGQVQHPAVGMSYTSMPGTTPQVVQNMNAYGNMPGMMGSEMDVDRMNIWWDQSYGTFDMEVVNPDQNAGGDGYQFQNFGSGF
ncbi:hypothetical protein D0Z07_6611 [Hyphodiscus hymeniophilus]|uniref:Xylanolytic transcriptional activator regulatory domain-containing protein n=1 Tax=Hyphodiscus hymeniophilus TaxID=353542 RepID=A0A9P6VGW7_9HELO|nr:hypothetical protein D0Z07_6611 [Hyphodiscus hymeniophilus]